MVELGDDMEILYAILFIVIVFGALGILYICQYNKLQHGKTKIDQAEYLIDEALRNKYDILIKADELSKKELNKDKSFFKDLAELKDENISNFDLDRKLKEFDGILNQLKADYKEFGENKELKKIISDNKRNDEKLQAAKSYYNKYTTELNELIRKFPSNIVARMHGWDIKEYFDGKNMQDEIIDDFKL